MYNILMERLIRLGLLVGVIAVLVGGAKFVLAQGKKSTGSPFKPMVGAVENLGEKVLGAAVKQLPRAPNLDEVKVSGEDKNATVSNEPIMEPAQNIQEQTQALIESIKRLPEDQIEAIRKQVYKEVCDGLLKGN